MTVLVMTSVDVQESRGWQSRIDMTGLATYVGDAMVEKSRAIVPVDTGALKGSIRYDITMSSWLLAVVQISANTYYAIYVEKGTSRMRAQAYLLPALKPGVEDGMRDWEPGEKKPLNSGKSISAEEARRSRTGAVEVQKRRDAKAAKSAQAAKTPANVRSTPNG